MSIPVTPHGVRAEDVYLFFSGAATEKKARQNARQLCAKLRNLTCLNNEYFIGSCEQLAQFLACLRGRNGETANQLRERFYAEHAHILQDLPRSPEHGKKMSTMCHVLTH
jgi:hypothetical protein